MTDLSNLASVDNNLRLFFPSTFVFRQSRWAGRNTTIWLMNIPLVCLLLDCAIVLFSIIIKSSLPFKESTNWDDLSRRYPSLQNPQNRRKANIDLFLMLTGVAMSFILLYVSQKYNNHIYSIIFLLIAIAFIYDGTVALSSGIYGIGWRNNVRFYYDKDKKFVWVAKSQILVSILVSVIIVTLLWWFLF